jgi:hypothetical protein
LSYQVKVKLGKFSGLLFKIEQELIVNPLNQGADDRTLGRPVGFFSAVTADDSIVR